MKSKIEKMGNDRTNFGIYILKIFMSFEVICCHFWSQNNIPLYLKPFDILRGVALPVFVCITFVFGYKVIISSNLALLKKKINRLYIPHIIWAVIYWIIYCGLSLWGKMEHVKFTDLLWQIGTGHSENLNPSMWYQVDVIVIFVLFFAIYKLMGKKQSAYIVVGLSAIAFTLQYTGINYAFFENFRYELKYPLGRILEILPFAAIGTLLSGTEFLLKAKIKWRRSASTSVILLVFFYFIRKIDLQICVHGFSYTGIAVLGMACCLVVFSYVLPLNQLPEIWKHVIRFCSKYTFGIYCIHRLVAKIVGISFGLDKNQMSTFGFCVGIYFLSFTFSILISKINVKWIKGIVE